MPDFSSLYTEYENTKDVCKFCEDHKDGQVAIRFLLIRSLDAKSLKEIIQAYSGDTTDGNLRVLTQKAYQSPVSVDQLIAFIESKRSELIQKREDELNGLGDVLERFPVVNCGIRNDKVDSIVQSFVRNKSLKTIDELTQNLDNAVLPRIRQYCLWSYYNQTSNDIIELFFLKHPAVIPSIRKIHDVDFFVKIGEDIIPFDLKFTHISDDFFDLASQGILQNDDPELHDNFSIRHDPESSEIKRIKSFYSRIKREHREYNLPNYGNLDKNSLCEKLYATGDIEAQRFIDEMKNNHRRYVPATRDELFPLEWWNYKYQGERLFCNNNRIFVFLAYRNRFTEGRELKGKTEQIGTKIKEMLDSIQDEGIHIIKYRYEKDASREGDYTAMSVSAIYSE